jgi:hypothetical protein
VICPNLGGVAHFHPAMMKTLLASLISSEDEDEDEI